MLMIMMRTANPIWLEPKGAEVEKFTGEPGLVVKWNPLVAGGTAKPERIAGENIPSTLFQYRALIKAEIEELTGTYDVLKGQRPPSVEAFATMNFLVERGLIFHQGAFKERGKCYKGFMKDALEIEREFGDETRTRAIMRPTQEWAFETYKRADLSGTVEIVIEDGTTAPKTALGERASIEHLNSLGFIDPADPEQRYAIYQKFGQASLMPGVDAQVQECWMNLERFEKQLRQPGVGQALQVMTQRAQLAQATMPPAGPAGPGGAPGAAPGMPGMVPQPPALLKFKRWYNPVIHRQEVIKWCLSDRGRKLFQEVPVAEQQIDQYLQQIEQVIAIAQAAMMPQAPGKPGGNGGSEAMANSNRNSAGAGGSSSGAGGTAEPVDTAA